MAKYVVKGRGYLGAHLVKKLEQEGFEVGFYPKKDTETIFYMGGVTHMDFNENIDYFRELLSSEFNAIVEYCKRSNVRLVFCSSALVYEESTEFSLFKKYLEVRASKELPNSLALRIFPVYGDEKKTAIAKFCDAAKHDRSVDVFGNGKQTRSFIHIDDVVHYIWDMEKCQTKGLVDVGTDNPTSFDDIIDTVSQIAGKKLIVNYVDPPSGYRMEGVVPEKPLPVITNLNDGIRKILLESTI